MLNISSGSALSPDNRTNVDLSSKVFYGIHLWAISQEVLMNLIRNMCTEITTWNLLPYLPGANELKALFHHNLA